MILLWHFYWPVLAAGLAIGVLTGYFFYRRARPHSAPGLARKRNLAFAGGAALALLFAGLWHAPLGAGDRLSASIEAAARTTLVSYEMESVTARVERSPLSRRLILSGPSDDIQQRELVRIMNGIPGVSEVIWANRPTAPVMMK